MKYNHIFIKGFIYLSCLELSPTPSPTSQKIMVKSYDIKDTHRFKLVVLFKSFRQSLNI